MNNIFYLILISFIFLLSACGDEREKGQKTFPNEPKIVSNHPSKERTPIRTELPKVPIIYNYEFKNLKNQLNALEIKNDIYNFKNIKQPIVIMTIISTWCPPCRGQIPHLSKLQKKFKENLFVMATLVHDDISKEQLNKFIIAQKMLIYLSITQEENLKFLNMITPRLGLSKDIPMPLTLVFVKGKYFTHYEGMIPEEMIESDINQLLQKIKK